MARLVLQSVILSDVYRKDLRETRNFRRIARYADKALAQSDDEFKRNYRVTKTFFHGLCQELVPLMQTPKRRSDISTKYKILVALSFFATGSYQRLVGSSLGTPMSQQSVSRALRDVFAALNSPSVLHKHIKFPQTEQERNVIKRKFYEKFSIPGVIGCIDGTHVAILRPAENERYFNRKHFHSRNVLIICDSDLNILSVDASFGGASHDSFIWNQHPIKDHLTQLINAGESAYLLGDSGYAQREYMMTPIVDAAAGSPEEHYTKMHVTARNTVEHTIGVLKNRWRCLLGHRVLHYHPVVAAKNINACCVLHNMCNRAHLIMEDDENPNNINRPSDAEPALQERAGASIELQSFYRVTIYIDLKYKDTSIIFN
ncbi:putative nuclease HARBI1 isoform X2 [Plodia interpunctella]|uniref:putative nuclease HARBI1 isoform X2 n=1 Tax=Plodia interpunctella TaxID=58824 RepID=UPI00236888F0|nr:putative nuclease HARBI1 isoform X2 [Plodia interpunctella]